MPDGSQPNSRRMHPGQGRRKASPTPKGRQIDTVAASEVQELLGDREIRRDLLIQYLHLIQDKFGCLQSSHLAALADEMKLSMSEVFEVASFFAHFDIVFDDETPPPPLTIRVCESLTCELKGAQDILKNLPAAVGDQVRVVGAPCMGRCQCAPVAEVGHNHVDNATVASLSKAAVDKDTHPRIPAYISYDDYVAGGGYNLLKDLQAGKTTPEALITTMKDSGLRGLGGAGFPSGMKWDFVRREPAPRLMAINGDEGEPGTFKDRHYLETDPHRFLEGMLVAATVAEAETVFVYIRDEYPAVLEILEKEIARVVSEGLNGSTGIELRRGAGAYICGEESAMLESIEGKRGLPRHKPPYPTQVGLFGRPTLIHNVETVYWVREIVEKGAEWFTRQGANGRKGLRSYSVSGHVKNPGVVLAPAGTTIQELIDNYCGGMEDGHTFKAYLPGGASGGILPARLNSIPLDFDTLQEYDCFIGSAAVVILSDQDNMKAVGLNLMKFFEDESCGQCTPCRNGTEKAVQLMSEEKWDVELLADLSQVMMDSSICGLGQAAPNPLNSIIKHFSDDLA